MWLCTTDYSHRGPSPPYPYPLVALSPSKGRPKSKFPKCDSRSCLLWVALMHRLKGMWPPRLCSIDGVPLASSKVSSDRRCVNQNNMKKENTHVLPSLGYHGEATTLPSTWSPPLLYGIIKMVSNGHGPSLLAEVIFTAINLLGWCVVGGIILPSTGSAFVRSHPRSTGHRGFFYLPCENKGR
jgi:hypothetical protein